MGAMPTFGGVTGRVYYKAWRVPVPRAAAVVFLHGFGEHSGLYHRLGYALNDAGIELWALDEIGHGLPEGDRAIIRSIDHLVQNGRQLAAVLDEMVDGPDYSPITLGQPVADLVECPEFDPRVVQRVAEPVVKPRMLAEAV